jgi:hypothetical protein
MDQPHFLPLCQLAAGTLRATEMNRNIRDVPRLSCRALLEAEARGDNLSESLTLLSVRLSAKIAPNPEGGN